MGGGSPPPGGNSGAALRNPEIFGRGPFSDGCRGGRPWLRRRSHALCARSAELRSVRAPATTRATPEATNLAVYNRLRIGATSAALAVMDDSGLPRAETRVRSGFWTGGMDSAAGSAVIRAIGPARTTCPRADATARARWSEASCFGRSSWAVAVPGAVTCHNPPIVAAITSMLHRCPLDASSTTDHHRRSRSHCLGHRLARPRHRTPLAARSPNHARHRDANAATSPPRPPTAARMIPRSTLACETERPQSLDFRASQSARPRRPSPHRPRVAGSKYRSSFKTF